MVEGFKGLDELAEIQSPRLNKVTKKVLDIPAPTFGIGEVLGTVNYAGPALYKLLARYPQLHSFVRNILQHPVFTP